jgi:hypothetical protein
MVVADKLGLHLEFGDVCNSLGWGRSLGKELRWQAVTKDCLSIIVLYMFYEWNAPQLCLVAVPALEDGGSRDCDFFIVSSVSVHLVLVENCDMICVHERGYADQQIASDCWYDVPIFCWRS